MFSFIWCFSSDFLSWIIYKYFQKMFFFFFSFSSFFSIKLSLTNNKIWYKIIFFLLFYIAIVDGMRVGAPTSFTDRSCEEALNSSITDPQFCYFTKSPLKKDPFLAEWHYLNRNRNAKIFSWVIQTKRGNFK